MRPAFSMAAQDYGIKTTMATERLYLDLQCNGAASPEGGRNA